MDKKNRHFNQLAKVPFFERGYRGRVPKWACSVVVNKFRIKRTVGQADMTLALLGQNLYKYLGTI